MALTPFHTVLEPHIAGHAFYPFLRPEDVAAIVCVDKACQERVGWLCADLRLIGQIFRHRLIELSDDQLFDAYVEKNLKRPEVLKGIVAAHSNGKLHELWNKQVRSASVTPLPVARALLAVMQVWKIWVDFDWDVTTAATMGNTSIVQALLEMDVPKEKLCLKPEEPSSTLRRSLAALHPDRNSFLRYMWQGRHEIDERTQDPMRLAIECFLKRPHLAALDLSRPRRQFETSRAKMPTPLETVDTAFRQALKASFPWHVIDGILIKEDPKQLAIVQVILWSPKYGHRVSFRPSDCMSLIDEGKTEMARRMLALPQLVTPATAKQRKSMRLCIATMEGNLEDVKSILTCHTFAIPVWDGLAWISVTKAFCRAIERGHKEVYALGKTHLFSQHPIVQNILSDAIAEGKADIIVNLLQFEEGFSFPGLEEIVQKAFAWKRTAMIELVLSCPTLLRREGILDRVIDLCLLGLDAPLPDSLNERRSVFSDWGGNWDTCQGLYFKLIKRVLKSKWKQEVTLDCLKRVEDRLVKEIGEARKKDDSLSPVMLQLYLKLVIYTQTVHLISAPPIPPIPQVSPPLTQPGELIDEKETQLVEPPRWYTRLLSAGMSALHYIAHLVAYLVKAASFLFR